MKRLNVSRMALLVMLCLSCCCVQLKAAEPRYFSASDACEAFQSFRKRTNPGNVRLTVGMTYEVIEQNKPEPTHYRMKVKGASPMERWVPVSCGVLSGDRRTTAPETSSLAPASDSSSSRSSNVQYLLALSWQPAFCQTHQNKKECVSQNEERYDANHFTLHGLWPQPRNNVYCNVGSNEKSLDKRSKWAQLPNLELSDATYSELSEIMPGVVSYLHRHEWIKHGSCYSLMPEEYFRESMLLVKQVNGSAVRDFFAANIGRVVSTDDIKARFDAAFGEGAGDKVRVKCSNGMLTELWINLKGDVDEQTRIENLLQQAPRASSSCREGLIDPVGY